jgi:hypothetical protein
VIKLYSREEIEAAKERLRIPELWRRLDLPGEPKPSCRSPFRDDHRPSFGIFGDDRIAIDYATGEVFDGPAFVAKALGVSAGEGLRGFMEMAGGRVNDNSSVGRLDSPAPRDKFPRTKPDLSKLRPPTDTELGAIARDRGLCLAALEIAKRLGCLKCGTVCRFRSWIITDPVGWNAEARRFGRLPYPPWGDLSERKAHTIRGSLKSWRVGLGVDQALIKKASLIAITEGGPDLPAAWHFIYCTKRWDVLPIATLGRAVHGLHPDALKLLVDKPIKFFPHVDPDGGGLKQVELISEQQLQVIGCLPMYFDLTGLRTHDGKPVKDLNDLTQLDTNQLGEIGDLFLWRTPILKKIARTNGLLKKIPSEN